MIRTQIYIDEELHKELQLLAKEQKEPMAKIARDILSEAIKKKNIDKSGKNTLLSLVNLKLSGGDKNLSSNVDSYLYQTSHQDE